MEEEIWHRLVFILSLHICPEEISGFFCMVTEEDIRFMERALDLARRGEGWVNPNPLVGAVIVRDGRVIGEGWHERFGGWHAERNALRNCKEGADGATLYVTLEPCCHYGKTPPCTEAILEAGVKRVVVGMKDPNPLVAGKGIGLLREAGVEVEVGVCEEKACRLNRAFVKYITERCPWVVMKNAMTLDGKIATCNGDSKWVTGEEARRMGHRLRHRCMAIMVGVGTVRADDPMLDCRLEGEVRQPVRVVVDSKASIPLRSRLVMTASDYRTIVAHTEEAPQEHLRQLAEDGVETLLCGTREGRVDCADLLGRLGESGIDSVLLEGGSELNGSFLTAKLIDEAYVFIAPKLVGGAGAKTPVGGKGMLRMAEALPLEEVECMRVGNDILVHGLIK